MATSFVVRVAGVPERNPVTHDEDPRRAAMTAGLRPRAIRLWTASTVVRAFHPRDLCAPNAPGSCVP